MDEDRDRRAAELRALFEQGILTEDTFRPAMAGLGLPTPTATATEAGAVAQHHSIALAERAAQADDVEGSIVTGDHNIVAGRDATAGLTAPELNALFAPIMAAIAAAPAGTQTAAAGIVADLQAEVEKGKAANDGLMAGLIRGLVAIVPGTVAGLVTAFAHPVLAGLASPATQVILNSIR